MRTRIKCGSRDLTISCRPNSGLAWMRLNDLGSVGHFAMDAKAARKIAAAALAVAARLEAEAAAKSRKVKA